MRKTLLSFSLLTTFGVVPSLVGETPIVVEPPSATAVEQPMPIAPPVEAENPAVPGTVTPPVESPAPAVPGVVTPPVQTTVVAEVGPLPMVNEFQGEEIGAVLRLLARQGGINLVVSDQVQGTITMRLEGLTPLEAIRVVVTAKGLIMDQIDRVYYIKTPAEKQREPTESGHFTFSYASADKVLDLVKSQIQCGIPPQCDVRTNTIYYRDFKSNMANLELFLESIDRPTTQVMIEARLVEVNANPNQNYGINWSGVLGGSERAKAFSLSGAQEIKVDGNGGAAVTLGDMMFNAWGNGPGGMAAAAGQLAILTAPQMTATLRLLNEDSDAEFLANPRVVTANNLEAKIEIVRNQPVPQLNFNEQTATAVFGGFIDKNFGNTLYVKPTINKDDFVTLQVRPKISNKVGDATFTFANSQVSSPIIDERSLESTVLIRSGDTLAIGGLLQDETTKQRAKVPVLGDIPILGYVFQERMNSRRKRNLLVFVTPTIIKQGYGTGLEDQVSGLKNSGEEFADPNGWRNNARGAIRLVPTSNRQIISDHPKPGMPPVPARRVKTSSAVRR